MTHYRSKFLPLVARLFVRQERVSLGPCERSLCIRAAMRPPTPGSRSLAANTGKCNYQRKFGQGKLHSASLISHEDNGSCLCKSPREAFRPTDSKDSTTENCPANFVVARIRTI